MTGHISAMLWNGVIRTPRFSVYRCRYSSSSGSATAADAPPFTGGTGLNRYSARVPSRTTHHGSSLLSSTV